MKTAYWGIFAALPALLLCGCGENSSQKKNNISRNSYLAYRNDSLNNLKHIGMGIIIYAYYHNDNAPANLTDLEGYVGNLFFVAKFDKKHHQPEDNHISQAESSYAYIGNIGNLSALKSPEKTPLAFEKPSLLPENHSDLLVLFADGDTEIVAITDVSKMSCQQITEILTANLNDPAVRDKLLKNAMDADNQK